MSEPIWNMDRLRSRLNQLFEAAGYEDEELKKFFEQAVSQTTERVNRKSGTTSSRATDMMSSKLRDALRE